MSYKPQSIIFLLYCPENEGEKYQQKAETVVQKYGEIGNITCNFKNGKF